MLGISSTATKPSHRRVLRRITNEKGQEQVVAQGISIAVTCFSPKIERKGRGVAAGNAGLVGQQRAPPSIGCRPIVHPKMS